MKTRLTRFISGLAGLALAAIADVLLGNHNPSGRLPLTFPVKWQDCSAYGSYKHQDSLSVYSDGVFVGYRRFGKHNIKPLFPFGYKLSKTQPRGIS
jgi:beta-glucosidase